VDAPNNPILYSYNDRTSGCLSGPGHQALFEVGARQFIVFHAHAARGGCRNANKAAICISRRCCGGTASPRSA
jgi:hypothetical protein